MTEYYFRLFIQFFDDMRKQKLRCFLTMSGITWGTLSVILLLAFGTSFRKATIAGMSGMGANIVILSGNRTGLPYRGIPAGRHIRLDEAAAQRLRNAVPEISELSPEIQQWVLLSVGENRQNFNLVGVNPEYGIMRNLPARPGGRFIDELDMKNRRRVVFIGTSIKDTFFKDVDDPVGLTLTVNGTPFTVIGVMQDKTQSSSYMNQDRSIVFIPYTTGREMYGITFISRIIYRARTAGETPAMKARTYQILGRTLGFDPDDTDALNMWDTSEATRFLETFFMGFELFLLLGGMFTLVVGGIGVANIMYVTVRERRREIGIKSALGATPNQILGQFMIEAFLIMAAGGGIGVLGAWGIVSIVGSPMLAGAHAFIGKPSIDLTTALITASLLLVIGFAAGWSPAKAAADMEPVRALGF